jgi:hypothetical protein
MIMVNAQFAKIGGEADGNCQWVSEQVAGIIRQRRIALKQGGQIKERRKTSRYRFMNIPILEKQRWLIPNKDSEQVVLG